MVLEPNHLYPERNNIENKYDVDYVIKETKTDNIVFYAEVEYDASGKLFNEKGEIRYEKINILARKYKYFTKDKPTFFIKGRLNPYIALVIPGYYILKNGIYSEIPCSFRNHEKGIIDEIYQINRDKAINDQCLLYGPLNEWLHYVKTLFANQGLKLYTQGGYPSD